MKPLSGNALRCFNPRFLSTPSATAFVLKDPACRMRHSRHHVIKESECRKAGCPGRLEYVRLRVRLTQNSDATVSRHVSNAFHTQQPVHC